MLNRLPDDLTLEDIQYHVCVMKGILEGIADVDAGKVIPHEEAVRRSKEWLKSRD